MRHRHPHILARALAPALLVAAAMVIAVGCASPPATVTAPPVAPTATAVDGAPIRSLSIISGTAGAVVTAMPTAADAWPVGEPYPVALPEEVAAREVLRWLDPARDPRIDWTRLVRREDVARAWGEEPMVDAARPGRRIMTLQTLPPVLVAVLASVGGMSRQAVTERGVVPNPCWGVPEGEREQVFVAFDASTGAVAFAEVVYPGLATPVANAASWPTVPPAPVARPLSAVPTFVPTPVSKAHIAPTPTPMPVPAAARPLSAETAPAALRASLEAWPLLPGNRWRWRVTTREEGVRWLVALVTETVSAGWVLDDETALVRTEIEVQPLTALAPRDVAPGTLWRTITPRGVFASAESAADTTRLRMLGIVDSAGKAVAPVPVEPEHTSLLGGRIAAPAQLANVAPDVGVVTGAGAFTGCTRYDLAGGSGWGSKRWLCPGLGQVRNEKHACSATYGAFTVFDLLGADLASVVD